MKKTNDIREALDKIKSDDESKRKLQEDVLKRLEEKKNKRRKIRSLWRIAASFLIITGISAAAGLYYFMPVNDVSIDINSLGLQLNLSRAGRIVDCYYYDGNTVGLNVKGMDLSRAIFKIIGASSDGKSSDSALIVLSVRADSENGAEALRLKVEEEIIKNASAQNISASVYCVSVDTDMTRSAKNEEVTPGKYYITKLVQSVKPEAQTDKLVKLSVDSLVNMFMETYRDSLNSEEIEQGQVPLAPFPGNVPADAPAVNAPEDITGILSEDEIEKQYAKLSGLIK